MANSPTSAELTDAKVVPESILGTEAVAGSYRDAAKKIRADIDAESPPKALTNIEAQGMAPFHEAEITAALDGVISADKDASGVDIRVDGKKQRTGANETKFNDTRDKLTTANTILKDVNDLTSTQIMQMHREIQAMLRTTYPEAADVLATATTDAERKAILQNIFTNPSFARALHGKLEGILRREQPKIPAELADRVANSQSELTQKDIELRAKQKEYDESEFHVKDFDTTDTRGGKKQTELEKLIKQKDTLEKNSQEAQREIAEAKAKVEALRSQHDKESTAASGPRAEKGGVVYTPSVTQPEADATRVKLDTALNTLATKEKAYDENQRQLARMKELQEEKQQAIKDFQEAEKAKAIADAEKSAAQTRHTNAQIELDEAKLGVHEDKFIKDAESVISDSVKEFLATEMRKSDEKRRDLLQQAKNSESDTVKAAFDQQLSERWHKKGKTNKSMVDEDLKALLISEDDLKNRLGVSDEVWKDKKEEAIAALLGYRLNMGSLPANEGWMIFNKYGENMFTLAEAKKEEFRNWMKNAEENGWIKGKGWEAFKEFAGNHKGMIAILLALLVAGGAQVLAPGWTVAKLAGGAKALGSKYAASHVGQ